MPETPSSHIESQERQTDTINRLGRMEREIGSVSEKTIELENKFDNLARLNYAESIDRRTVKIEERLDIIENKVVDRLERILLQLDIASNNAELMRSIKASINDMVASVKNGQNREGKDVKEVEEV